MGLRRTTVDKEIAVLKWFLRYKLISSIIRAVRGRQAQGGQRARGPQGGPGRR